MDARATRRARGFWRRNWAHVAGWFVVIFAVGALGAAQALPGQNTVDSGDIINGEVKKVDLAASAVNSRKVQDGTLSGVDIANGGITGADIKNYSVRTIDLRAGAVTSVKVKDETLTGADVANGSLTGADVVNDSLGGADIHEGSLNFGCGQPGLANAWVYVYGRSSIPSSYTSSSAYMPARFNCSNGSIEVKKTGVGDYHLKFSGIGTPWIGFALVDSGTGDCHRSTITYNAVATGEYRIRIHDHNGSAENCEFTFGLF